MKILFGGHPILFCKHGGLQEQILNLKENMKNKGHEVFLFHEVVGKKNLYFDVYHHFGLSEDSYSTFLFGRSISKKVVLSPIFNTKISRLIKKIILSLDLLKLKIYKFKIKSDMFEKSDGLNFLSNYEKVNCDFFYKNKNKKNLITLNGVSIKKNNPNLKQSYILQISNVYRHKRIDISAKIAKKLNRKLIVVGNIDDVTYKNELEKKYNNIEFVGYLNNKSNEFFELVSQASISLLPSKSEVSPISNLESLILGTNVVCTINTAALDEQKILGVCFSNFNKINDTIKIINNLIDKTPDIDSISMIEKKCSWSKITTDILEFYKSM